jgi:hypothetical protein
MNFLNHIGKVIWISVRFFPPFSFTEYGRTLNCRNCKRLREFEEKEISRQAAEVTVNSKEENS